jgi:hypothetical protein
MRGTLITCPRVRARPSPPTIVIAPGLWEPSSNGLPDELNISLHVSHSTGHPHAGKIEHCLFSCSTASRSAPFMPAD